MSETNEREQSSPTSRRWQFSLRQMFAAITGVAILLGWAAWSGWADTYAVVYLSLALMAGIFSRVARRVLIGACLVIFVIWLTGVLRHLTEFHLGLWLGSERINPIALCLSTLLILCFAIFLRANSHITIWALAGSFILVELFVAAAILDAEGLCWKGSTLFDALGFNGTDQIRAEWIRQVFVDHLLKQRWCIVAPWLLGIVVGEIIVRRRKPSSGTLHAV